MTTAIWRGPLTCQPNKPGTGEKGNTGSGYLVAAKRGLLVVATAMLFHHRLQGHLPELQPAEYDGEWPPASPAVCAEQSAAVGAFQEAWRGILAVDYRPVFLTRRAALGAISAQSRQWPGRPKSGPGGRPHIGRGRRVAP